jgi:hypothetical protein
MVETLRFTRGNLPHWLVADHAYFVTIRLAGTIPKSVVTELQTERDALAKANANEEALTELARRQFLRVERCLHAVDGSPGQECQSFCWPVWTGLRNSVDGMCTPSRSCRITRTFCCGTTRGAVANCWRTLVSARTTRRGKPIGSLGGPVPSGRAKGSIIGAATKQRLSASRGTSAPTR